MLVCVDGLDDAVGGAGPGCDALVAGVELLQAGPLVLGHSQGPAGEQDAVPVDQRDV